ncbi:hypothetical protein DPMN_032101 [Dreissena polymorpha]|uniref:ShKT domain-containing protein n=1 Tax=Dreissena polymorpha TaxID=45954 RepID=A0A9D4M5X2_DREPO|nr:hypothetical protein DPMN_032101 [Dreissena polymorpha]
MEGITTFALLTALLFTRIQSNADCVDDITVNCYMMDALFRVCNGSKEHAALVCPKTCNLCNYVNGKWLDWGKMVSMYRHLWNHCPNANQNVCKAFSIQKSQRLRRLIRRI